MSSSIVLNWDKYIIITLTISISVATVSFSDETYSVGESEQKLIVSILRSGDIESSVVVLIANHPYAGTAFGKFFPYYLIITILFCVIISAYNPSLFTPFFAYIYSSLLSSLPYCSWTRLFHSLKNFGI